MTELLSEGHRTLTRIQRGPLVRLGAFALTAAVIWPFTAPAIPALPGGPVLHFAPAGAALLIAVASLTLVHVRWKRALTQGALAGYREVLGLARAHGIEPTHVPAWLEGRTPGGSGKGAAPIPAYPRAELPQPTAPVPDRPLSPSPPPKPDTVTAYERIAEAGGWHDEAGCLLFLAGAGGAVWAVTSDMPVGHAALLLVPVAIAVWLAGHRQGAEKERLRAEAKAYVEAVAAAQLAGHRVPELSPVLRRLLDEQHERGD